MPTPLVKPVVPYGTHIIICLAYRRKQGRISYIKIPGPFPVNMQMRGDKKIPKKQENNKFLKENPILTVFRYLIPPSEPVECFGILFDILVGFTPIKQVNFKTYPTVGKV